MSKWICRQCKGVNIQTLSWVDPNGSELQKWNMDDGNQAWYDNCNDNVAMVK